MSSKKKVKKTNHDAVSSLFTDLLQLLEVENDKNSDVIDKLKEAKNEFFEESNKTKLRALQKQIAAALRGTPKDSRPNDESKVGFFLWVLETIPDAEEGLRLIDELDWCPDAFRKEIWNNYTEARFNYNTL